mmetsp:Transcript_80698/g.224600  ORF Transcript_80698/g.224600 Transcript_80698/m.224600 type:complete len:321 (+) Transcript_80698:86-1048(+)
MCKIALSRASLQLRFSLTAFRAVNAAKVRPRVLQCGVELGKGSLQHTAPSWGSSCTARWQSLKALDNSQILSKRGFASRGGAPASYYSLLGVPRTASAAEIKRAYLREAKKYHPDINKAPDATARFKELAQAYDVLRDPARRASYDDSLDDERGHAASGGAGYGQSTQDQRAQGHDGQQDQGLGQAPSLHDVDPFELFRSVLEELGVEQLATYLEQFRDEANHAAASAKAGDMQPAKEFLWRHKVFAASIVLPFALAFRFPGAVVVVLRLCVAAPSIVLAAALRDPRLFALLTPLRRFLFMKWRIVAERAAARSRQKRGG